MKKMMIALVALVLVAGAVARADTTNTYTNTYGDVITAVTTDMGVKTTTIVHSGAQSATLRPRVAALGWQISTNMNDTETATQYTPRDIGDGLIFTSTNAVYVSTGVTTNDWVKLAP